MDDTLHSFVGVMAYFIQGIGISFLWGLVKVRSIGLRLYYLGYHNGFAGVSNQSEPARAQMVHIPRIAYSGAVPYLGMR